MQKFDDLANTLSALIELGRFIFGCRKGITVHFHISVQFAERESQSVIWKKIHTWTTSHHHLTSLLTFDGYEYKLNHLKIQVIIFLEMVGDN